MSKKDKEPSNPRKITLTVGVEPGSKLKMKFDEAAQRLGFAVARNGKPTRPTSWTINLSYERTSGKDKHLNRIWLPGEASPRLDQDGNLGKFDVVVAVDTNSKTCLGHTICVSCVVVGVFDRYDTGYALRYMPQVAYEFWNPNFIAEKFGWLQAIDSIQNRSNGFDKQMRIGLIVDANLSELEPINRRIQPIAQGRMLPANMTMLYASADAGKRHNANKLLRKADEMAGEILDFVCQYGQQLEEPQTDQPNCTHFRRWHSRAFIESSKQTNEGS